MTQLAVPDVTGMDVINAALEYAKNGWYVGPVRRGTKNPGSVLGSDWQHRTSRDPKMIIAWMTLAGHGVFLHAGRSGAVIFDIDHTGALAACPVLVDAIAGHIRGGHPVQSTGPGRGHYPFLQPPGRYLGNSKGKLAGGWGEVRGRNGVILAEPTPHPESRHYKWLATGPVPMLPVAIAELLPDAFESEDAATDAEVAAFLAEHARNSRPRYLAGPVRRYHAKVAEGGARHDSALASTVWAAKEARAGYYPAAAAFGQIGDLFTADAIKDMPRRKTRDTEAAADEYKGIVAWSIAQAMKADLDEVRRIAERNDARTFTPGGPLAQLCAFIDQLREWLDLPDPAHVLLTLATAATRDLDGEPVWLLLVAVPSSGKTETVRLLDKRADGRLNEVTAAGLLGWTKGKESKPSGVLPRLLGPHGLVTFGDLSSLLATSDGGGRDAAFGLLRRAYDGHVTRDISPPGKPAPGHETQLCWSGRLTVVAAVTGAIDRYTVHADQLGPRWVYTRIAERGTEAKRRATDRARKGGLDEYRDTACKAADRLIIDAATRIENDVPDTVFDAIKEAALVTCWGRAAVPRHGYGRREIDGIPVIEDPPRVVRQLHALARGLLALGLPEDYTAGLARRVALDSMPEDRRAVLAALSTGELLSTSGLARASRLDRKVARMRAEELEAIGVVHGDRDGTDLEEEYDRRPVKWRLAGDDGQVIADVFAEHQAARGWDEIMLTHTSTHPEQERADEGNHNFVPPSEPRMTSGGAP
jgi:hypothetical protein